MTTETTQDWTEYDAVNVLALPLHRWAYRESYRREGGWDGAIRDLIYSNGTEHGFAAERAETILDLGPMLRRVLLAGVRALADDPTFEAYTTALAIGDREAILRIEDEALAVTP